MIQTYYSDFEDGGNEKQFHFVEVLPSGSTDEPIHVTNENLLQESVKLTESLCSEDNLRFGACESSELTMTIANVFENFEGRTFHAYVHMLDDNSNDVIVNYGYFTVKSDKPQANRVWRKITAYDAMNTILNADVLTWFRGLTFPMTLAAFRNSFFTHLGITQKVQSLINDSFSIPGGFTASEYLSGKTIITAICELNGVFGHINRDGNFEYVSFGGNAGFVCPPFENNSVTYEDYTTDLITKITMRGSASDVGTSVGVDGNEYIITGNPLIYGTEGESTLITALNNLLAKIGTVSFRPYTVGKTIGNPCVELGDAITVNTTYETITSAVVSRVLSGIQALRDKYSASGYKTYPTDVNSYSSEVSRTQGKVNELTRTVDETVSTVATYSTAIATANQNAYTAVSTVQQMANKIVLKVDSNSGNIVQAALESDPSTGSTFKVSADNISFFANGVMELSANNLQINSTNFKVDSAGNVTANSLTSNNATITGGKLDIQYQESSGLSRTIIQDGCIEQRYTDNQTSNSTSLRIYESSIFGPKFKLLYNPQYDEGNFELSSNSSLTGGYVFKIYKPNEQGFAPYGLVCGITNDGAATFSRSLRLYDHNSGSAINSWEFRADHNGNTDYVYIEWSKRDGTSGTLDCSKLGYLSGVTSAIQTQLDGKVATTDTIAIAHGGTGATTRLNALKALTNENVGTSAQYFLTITDSWGKGGYTSVANAKTVLGLGSAAYLTADTSATANTVAKRQGNGYLYATYFNTSAGSENPASFTAYPAFIDSNGWLRKSSKANMTSWLGIDALNSNTVKTVETGWGTSCTITGRGTGLIFLNVWVVSYWCSSTSGLEVCSLAKGWNKSNSSGSVTFNPSSADGSGSNITVKRTSGSNKITVTTTTSYTIRIMS